MKRLSVFPLDILAFVSLVMPIASASAAISFSGNVEPEPTTWSGTTTGYVGNNSPGTLTVDGVSRLFLNNGYIGYGSSITGVVIISGTGSTLTSRNFFYVGGSGSGTLAITNGGLVTNSYGFIGYSADSSGTATVDGTGSKWSNSNLSVGNHGSGLLAISHGGTVGTSSYCYIGDDPGSSGTTTVDGTGSMLHNSNLLNIGNSGSGRLAVTNGGSVSSSSGHIGDNSGSSGTVTIDGSGSNWTKSESLSVGYSGVGRLTITNGGSVRNGSSYTGYGYIGYSSGSSGTAMVDGAGSVWISSSGLFVGRSGTGRLVITNGGSVSNSCGYIGASSGSSGTVTVDGAGSKWSNFHLFIASGMLAITNGGSVSNSCGYIGSSSGSSSIVILNGTGSTWTNNGTTYVGCSGTGTLNILGGGAVSACALDINSQSILAIDIGRGSSLAIGGGTDTMVNEGTVRVLAGASVGAGTTFTPIVSGPWGGTGTYQGIGGTLNASAHQFTTSAVVAGTVGSPMALDLANEQRVFVQDEANHWAMGASFLQKTSSSTLSFTGMTNTGGTLSGLLDTGDTVLSGWELSADGAYTAGDPMYLSFDVGHAQLLDDLQVWMFEGGEWTEFDAFDLTYDRTYASWTATAMGIYAVTGKLVLDGDADRDGSTNGTDLNAVLSNYNSSGNATWAMGDFNGDGSVNGSDLNTILSNYNQSLSSSTAAVPEPASVLLLAVMGLAGLVWVARKRVVQ